MSSIAITGGGGFFGWHLRARIHAHSPQSDVRVIDRTALADEPALTELLAGVDAVVHLAGVNRGSDGEVEAGNINLAERLIAALGRSGSSPVIVYANTTHHERETAYGRSKREVASLLKRWATDNGAALTDLVLPNLFGECGRPDYNSAVATFCRDLAEGRTSKVNADGVTELLHVQDACATVMSAIDGSQPGRQRLAGEEIAIPDLYGRLKRLRDMYRDAALPDLQDRLDLHLFNALRTAMFPAYYPMPLTAHTDQRGSFVELARGHGQTQGSFSTTAPGVTRGEHYHFDKIERFVVIRGRATIKLRRLFDAAVVTYEVDGDRPVVVDMPPLFAHNITNVGDDELLTVFWANDHFDPAVPDTFPEPVEPSHAGTAST